MLAIGQPVLVPGDMGRCSYVLAGTDRAMEETFGSSCHGAGRLLSRHAAMRAAKGRAIHRELADRGIEVMARGRKTLAEEMSDAYKDVSRVVAVMAATKATLPGSKPRSVGKERSPLVATKRAPDSMARHACARRS